MMITESKRLFLSLVVVLSYGNVYAWISLSPAQNTRRLLFRNIRNNHLTVVPAFFGPEQDPFVDDCESEEECEIDWDQMPDWESGEDSEEPASLESMKSNSLANEFERMRLCLEVSWKVNECSTDEDKCEDFCQSCAGKGSKRCRFCRGTNYMMLGGDFRVCPICKEGQEECTSCRGTGSVAPWASMAGHGLEGKLP